MENVPQQPGFGYALLFVVGAVLLIAGGLLTNYLLAPRRPNPEKNTSYECGEDPVGSSWLHFNSRFYVMGLIFLVFEVEIVLLLPWAVVLTDPGLLTAYPGWGWYALAEGIVFIGVLALGLVYVWRRGDIDWVRPNPLQPTNRNPVPIDMYAELNRRLQQSNQRT